MIKIVSALSLAIMFIACSDSSNNNVKEKSPVLATKVFEKKIECNEFGIAYYKQETTNSNVYSPVLIEKINDNNETTIVPISCKEYNEIMKK